MKQKNQDTITRLFSDMAFDDAEEVDIAGLKKWLADRSNRICSIINGEISASGKSAGKFTVGGTDIEAVAASTQLIEQTLARVPATLQDEPTKSVEQIKCLLDKSIAALESLKTILYQCESIATSIPFWQTLEWDVVNWTWVREQAINHPALGKDASISLVYVSKDGYSLEQILPALLGPFVRMEERPRAIILSCALPKDIPLLLPAYFILDTLNKSGIRKTPVDLILIDAGNNFQALEAVCRERSLPAFGNFSTLSGAGIQACPTYGVFQSNVLGAHYVVDSTADLVSAFSSISTDIWSSGNKVNQRTRPLIFVHESRYKEARDLLAAKLKSLEVAPGPFGKTTDFVLRPDFATEAGKMGKVLHGGNGSSFSNPTVVYDVGTSSDLVACPPPSSGHVAVLIPFRNNNEVVTLANNFDNNKQAYIFTSDVSFLKTVSMGLKATTVSVNTCTVPNNLQLKVPLNSYLLTCSSSVKSSASSPSARNALAKAAEAGQKALTAWKSTHISARISFAEKFLASLTENGLNVPEEDMRQLEKRVMRIASHILSGSWNSGLLFFEGAEALGLVAFLYHSNPDNLNVVTALLPLITSMIMGNVSLVTSANPGSKDANILGIINKAAAILPFGVVTVCQSSTSEETFSHAASLGKISAMFVIFPAIKNCMVSSEEYQMKAYNRIVVYTETGSRDADEASALCNFLLRSKRIIM